MGKVGTYDVVVLGAGAAGLMCAGRLGQGGLRVLLVDHAKAPGEKIRISGGGRCDFTNMGAAPECFLSENPHFAKSALARYTQWDFLDLVQRHGIAWHEKTLGQLFCDGRSTQITEMLLAEATGMDLWLRTEVVEVRAGYEVVLEREGARVTVRAPALVLATGGKSIPKMGATGLAYGLAAQFGLRVTETRPGLVPFTFPERRFADLAGVSLPVRLAAGGAAFEEAMLFTHRGLSGPAVLQASSHWREGEAVVADLDPGGVLAGALRAARRAVGKRGVETVLGAHLPARFLAAEGAGLGIGGRVGDLSDARIDAMVAGLRSWALVPGGTEGYRTAEVTLGGIATEGLSSRTMGAVGVPGLYAIGEAVDVTGWLGGYNFQWAWSSGVACAEAIVARGAA
ncbi:MAG: NAD(P)/FAD-dependent oxidoreductase [Shimia sp.]